MKRSSFPLLPFLAVSALVSAQQRVAPADFRPPIVLNPNQNGSNGTAASGAGPGASKTGAIPATSDATSGSSVVSSDYVLGPGDLLTLSEPEFDDTSIFTDKSFRVDNSGEVNFPLAGRVHAAGLTTVAVEAAVNQRLAKIMKNPAAVVGIAEFHSQPVSVLGAVNAPGIMQIAGNKNLFEVLSLAGGLREDAGNTIKITRNIASGSIPLPDAKLDSTGQFSVASVKVKTIMSATDPSQNILIMPEDVITVPKGEVVYVVGDVTKPGGFLLGESGTLSTLQVISLAEGLSKTSAPSRAEILREVPGVPGRTQIAVNVKLLLAGKSPDVPLQPNDILFIPNSSAKSAGYRTIDAIVNAASGGVYAASRF